MSSIPCSVAKLKLPHHVLLGLPALLIILTLGIWTMSTATLPEFKSSKSLVRPMHAADSTLRNVLAVIRWNSPHPERIPLLNKYQPFFDTVHISMPGLMPQHHRQFHNWTHDQSVDSDYIFSQVAAMMKLMLAAEPPMDAGGLMYFHFDAWIDPFAWNDMDPENIWYPSVQEPQEPRFVCMNSTASYRWWRWRLHIHDKAKAAAKAVDELGLGYKLDTDEWCIGWSDIYYVPRRFFVDYIILADVFRAFEVFHEVAIPTILHIIDQSRRPTPEQPVLQRIENCWGSCCAVDPTVEDVLTARCGHRLNYLSKEVTSAFYSKLDALTTDEKLEKVARETVPSAVPRKAG